MEDWQCCQFSSTKVHKIGRYSAPKWQKKLGDGANRSLSICLLYFFTWSLWLIRSSCRRADPIQIYWVATPVLWTENTNLRHIIESAHRAGINSLCCTWMLIGQVPVPDQSVARPNRACLTGLLITNLHFNLYTSTLTLKPLICNLLPATCNLQLAICNLQPATYNIQLATCNLQHAMCNLQSVAYNLQTSTCNLQTLACKLQP